MKDASNDTSSWAELALMRELQLPAVEMARFLQLSAPALQRCIEKDGFSREHRSRLHRLATAMDRVQRVLGDRERAIAWMRSSNRALNFSTPLALMQTKSGSAQVYGVLLRIEQGRFA